MFKFSKNELAELFAQSQSAPLNILTDVAISAELEEFQCRIAGGGEFTAEEEQVLFGLFKETENGSKDERSDQTAAYNRTELLACCP